MDQFMERLFGPYITQPIQVSSQHVARKLYTDLMISRVVRICSAHVIDQELVRFANCGNPDLYSHVHVACWTTRMFADTGIQAIMTRTMHIYLVDVVCHSEVRLPNPILRSAEFPEMEDGPQIYRRKRTGNSYLHGPIIDTNNRPYNAPLSRNL